MNRRRRAVWAGSALIATAVIGGTLWLSPTRWHVQLTDSGPQGLWRSVPADGPYDPDTWVTACVDMDPQDLPPNAWVRKVAARGCVPMLKQVWRDDRQPNCGQPVKAELFGITDPCTGRHLPLPVGVLAMPLATGEAQGPVWVYSNHPQSLDSRHYGPVNPNRIATEVLTW